MSSPNLAIASRVHQLPNKFIAKLFTAFRRSAEASPAEALRRELMIASGGHNVADVREGANFLPALEERLDQLADERLRDLFNRYLSEC